jgi:Zn-dependent peptidase ImmA (M78 family)
VTERIAINPSIIRWALQRSGRTTDMLAGKLPKLGTWQTDGRANLTFVELERLSNETHTPLGFFFLDTPPPEDVPIPDFRTVRDKPIGRMSPDLTDTLHAMQLRQGWYQNFATEEGWPTHKFVGSARPGDPVKRVASDILGKLGLTAGWSSKLRSWDDAVSHLRERIEELRVLIVINGCVGNNTFRVLDPDEFRGFVLSDRRAPLIFVNGHDSKSAQVFTIFHELVHLWVNRSGLLDLKENARPADATEEYCNEVAAEALLPEDQVRSIWYSYETGDTPFHDLAKLFKVSPVVVGRRLLDLKLVSKPRFFDFYAAYQDSASTSIKRDSGGSFYNNQNFRIGKRFMRIVSGAANNGRITFTEAYKLTGLNNATFEKYRQRIGEASA